MPVLLNNQLPHCHECGALMVMVDMVGDGSDFITIVSCPQGHRERVSVFLYERERMLMGEFKKVHSCPDCGGINVYLFLKEKQGKGMYFVSLRCLSCGMRYHLGGVSATIMGLLTYNSRQPDQTGFLGTIRRNLVGGSTLTKKGG